MAERAHPCPGPGCKAQVPHSMLACRAHWYQVPRGLRNRVWAAWQDGAGAGSEAHDRAVAEAVRSMRPL